MARSNSTLMHEARTVGMDVHHFHRIYHYTPQHPEFNEDGSRNKLGWFAALPTGEQVYCGQDMQSAIEYIRESTHGKTKRLA